VRERKTRRRKRKEKKKKRKKESALARFINCTSPSTVQPHPPPRPIQANPQPFFLPRFLILLFPFPSGSGPKISFSSRAVYQKTNMGASRGDSHVDDDNDKKKRGSSGTYWW